MEDMIKNFENLNFYEVLEVPVNASYFEVRQAYKEALSIYNEDSLATYSLFSYTERETILNRIEEAFFVLIDDKKRTEYDRDLVKYGKVDESHLNKRVSNKAIPLFHTNKSKCKEVFEKRVQTKIDNNDHQSAREEVLSQDIISGKDLKRIRESLGIDLEEIFEITRINVSTLESIENDLFEKLPPPVYLENFLKSYAEILQLDREKVRKGYAKNIEHHRSEK